MIKITKLNKSFGRQHILRDIDLQIDQPGRITAVLGPNGSGKTTLIKCLLGMVIPDSGRIEINGAPVKNNWKYRSGIDYLPQIARFPENLRVDELIAMIKDIRGGSAGDEKLIARFGLAPYLQQRLGNLSGGTKQKVNLVLALMYDSPLLILDEPTSGLDPVAMIRLKELLLEEKQKGKIILMTSHIIQFVEEMADDIVFLLEGNIYFQGSIGQIKEQYGEKDLEKAIARILTGQNSVKMNGHKMNGTLLKKLVSV